MYIIDRYLLRQYVKTFLICWISLTGLYVVVDAFSNLDEFLRYSEKSGRPLHDVLGEYYLFRSIYFYDRVSAILAMIAGMFTVTWIQRHQELTALMAAGLSRVRVARPIFIAAGCLTLLGACSRELVIPQIRRHLARDPKDLVGDSTADLRARIDHDTGIIFTGQFIQPSEQKIHRPKFVLSSGLDTYGKHLSAIDAFYQPADANHPSGYWFKGVTSPIELLSEGSLKIGDRPVVLTARDHAAWLSTSDVFVVSRIDFDQLGFDSKLRQFMSTADLVRGLRNPSLDYGADVRVLIHSRMVQPLRDLTLLFLGLPLVLRRETRNIYAAIGMCIVLTAVYLVVTMACEYLGGILYIRPSLGAWLPLMIFVPIAAAMYDRIER